MDKLKDMGWDWAMLDVYMIGYAGLQDIVNVLHENNFIIHAHRAGHTAETRGAFGAEYSVFAKLWRLIGVDQLHTGTGVGKMEGAPALIRLYRDICRKTKMTEQPHLFSLGSNWDKKIKPIMPVASGGLNAGAVDALMVIYGHDVVVQCGGGIHGHPGGTTAGAKSVFDAVNGVMKNMDSKTITLKSKELKVALDTWGYVDPKEVKNNLTSVEKNRKLILKILMNTGYDAISMVNII
jgi:ribulose-bisphosphate carboxylase large chain